MSWYEALTVDADYIGHCADLKKLRKDLEFLKSQTRPKLHDLITLNMMEDVMMEKQGDAECVSDKQDKVVRRVTGQCSDVYWELYSHGGDLAFDMMLRKCVEVSNLKVSMDICKDRINEAQQALGDYIDRFRTNYKEEPSDEQA